MLESGKFALNESTDIRTDLPKYRVWEDGTLKAELESVVEEFLPDMVSFIIGCSFSFEDALIAAGLSVRHIDNGTNCPMYNTNIAN